MPSQHTFSIGRAAECDVVIADPSVSRRHAELLVLEDGSLFLVDCQSTGGTKVTQRGTTREIRQEVVEADATVHFGEVSMAISDLLEALRVKHAGAGLPARQTPASQSSSRQDRSWARGARLVRCRCGVVKPRGTRCRECGE
jgi:predicted component of type VI protein secretion system